MKKGKCTNYGDCDDAGKSFDIEDGQPFECPTCHNKLQEVDAKGKPVKSSSKKKKSKNGNNKLLLIIIGAVVVIGIIVTLIFTFSDNKEDVAEPLIVEEKADSIYENPEIITNRNDTLVIKVEGMENANPSDTIVKPADETVIEVATPQSQQTQSTKSQQTQSTKPQQTTSKASTPSSSSKNLGYGTWTGGLKNGQPHGMGTLTYSTSHTIDSRDSKGRVARPGEYIVGEWDNGHLVQGRWFKNDGTKEAVIIGKAG